MQLFDSHLHIIDPRFPLVENNGFLPAAFPTQSYLEQLKCFSIEPVGGAVVSGSFQAFDQAYLTDALAKLGPSYVGVTQLPHQVSDEELAQLHAKGVRAIRFNLKRGGSETVEHISYLAERVYDQHGWHIELYVDSRDLSELAPIIQTLPKISIDHLGLSRDGLQSLYQCVESGAYVKATGFGRVDFEPTEVIRQIMRINPSAVMFGTDLPCTRAPRAFSQDDIARCVDAFNEGELSNLFYKNAQSFYLTKVPAQDKA